MSTGSFLLSLVLVQVCILQPCVISSWPRLTAGQAGGGKFLCQDPIGSSPRLMSNHGREELDGHCSDSIFDEEELVDEEGFASDGGGSVAVEEDEGWLPDDDDDGGGGAKGSSSGSGGSKDVECPECGKFFRNDKSMFGHLRSHPNRGYKGATPPVIKLKLSSETTAATSPSSTSPSSPSRGGSHQSRPQCDYRLTPLELVAPYVLLTLQCQDNNGRATQQAPPPPCFRLCKQTEEVACVSKQTEDVPQKQTKDEIRQISSTMAAAEACSVLKIPKKRRNMLKEAPSKKTKLVPPPSPPPPPKEKGPYICKHCYAEFSTHQALGGHSAGHHRDIKKVPTQNDASSGAHHQGMAAQSQDGKLQVKGGGDDNSGWRDSGVSRRRGLLSEQLPMASNDVPRQSGQASGGQMIDRRQQHPRRKSDGLTLAAPALAPIPTQADNRGGRRLLNIDLNADATEHE